MERPWISRKDYAAVPPMSSDYWVTVVSSLAHLSASFGTGHPQHLPLTWLQLVQSKTDNIECSELLQKLVISQQKSQHFFNHARKQHERNYVPNDPFSSPPASRGKLSIQKNSDSQHSQLSPRRIQKNQPSSWANVLFLSPWYHLTELLKNN